MINNQAASSPNENGRDGDGLRGAVSGGEEVERPRVYDHGAMEEDRRVKKGRYGEQRYQGEHKGDVGSRMSKWKTANGGEYGRNRGVVWDRDRNDEERSRQGYSSRRDVGKGYGNGDLKTGQCGGRWSRDLEKGEIHEGGVRAAGTGDLVMGVDSSQVEKFSRCSAHPVSIDSVFSTKMASSLLLSDLQGVITAELPQTEEILPILLFFEKDVDGSRGIGPFLANGRLDSTQEGMMLEDVSLMDLGGRLRMNHLTGEEKIYVDIDEVGREGDGMVGVDSKEEVTGDMGVNNGDDVRMPWGATEGGGRDETPEELDDERYRYFLRRALPTVYKVPGMAARYVADQKSALLERARSNEAEISDVTSGPVNAPKNVVGEIPGICVDKWTEEDEEAFRSSVAKCGNDFKKMKERLPDVDTKVCVLKYYLMKNKTFSYIKRRPGRMSDSEIKLIVEHEWTSHEINMFVQHFKMFGKNWFKYQALISKNEKDLRIFFRYYTKFIVPPQKKASDAVAAQRPKKNAVSKSEILKRWTIDERQIFAIYFPYYNKNWISMATYFPAKTSSDLRQYYNRYYKGLSYNEQRLEASLYDFGRRLSTPPASHVGTTREETVFCNTAGVLFRG